MSRICKHCGACIPPRKGEGRCIKCAPIAVRWRILKCCLGIHGRPVIWCNRKPLLVKAKATDGTMVECYVDILQCDRCGTDIGISEARPG